VAENQNPVFTDGSLTGDGTVENPLGIPGGGGGITEITSDDGSVVISNPTGPTTDLSVPAGFLGNAVAFRAAGPVANSGSGSYEDVLVSAGIKVPASGSWQLVVMISFVITPDTGNTQILWKFTKGSDGSTIGLIGGETIVTADNSSFISRQWMAFEASDLWADEDAVHFQASCAGAGADFSSITMLAMLIPAGE
jgi:hypothetical protein